MWKLLLIGTICENYATRKKPRETGSLGQTQFEHIFRCNRGVEKIRLQSRTGFDRR
jgi:hypothetical protein